MKTTIGWLKTHLETDATPEKTGRSVHGQAEETVIAWQLDAADSQLPLASAVVPTIACIHASVSAAQ